MKFCPNCGAPIDAAHKFCASCGEKLPVPAMPAEPVYTDDPALLSNPVLNQTPNFDVPSAKEEKVPELTLEPDLWGIPVAASPAEPAAPAAAAAAAQAPSFSSVMEGVEYDNDYRREQEAARRRREEQLRKLEEERRRREEQSAQNPAPDNVPNDYTMSQPAYEQTEEPVPQLQDETLMLVWSIILTSLCSIFGLVGLVKTVKARKAPSLSRKAKLLSSAKVWLIIGTALYALAFLSNLF